MPVDHKLHRGLGRVAEPQILFPLIATLLLVVTWSTTIGLSSVREAAANHAAALSSRELVDTYEAQVVRALREIDQTLNLVRSWPERAANHRTLAGLKDNGLLPPDLLFVVGIVDANGDVVESTRPLAHTNVAHEDYFDQQRAGDGFFISRPPRGVTGSVPLTFSRRLSAADGAFEGVVIVSVDASYFVAGYEPDKLGRRGLLGLLGADGVFRVRRTGNEVFTGDTTSYAAMVAGAEDADARVSVDSWDGERRWTSARELYGFPLAVLVGLSADEQMAPALALTRAYRWWAALGSVLIVLLTGLLGRMSWQLGQSRLREVETRIAHAQRIEYLAFHDGLTALPNRSLFSKLLGQGIGEAQRQGKLLAVAFLDLDRFKQINDALGHEAGDQLLREVAARITGCVRDSDTVARLGGDEFVVLLPRLDTGAAVKDVAQKILAAIARPFTLIGQEFRVTASIGISVYPQDGHDEQTLTKNADVAMYHAKEEGKNNFQFYSAAFDAHSLERLTLESSLRHALERDEFRLHYQAKRDIRTGRITGMEALLRWENPDLGTVLPLQFIPVAEETGLILPLGKWVLRTACAQNVAWQKQGLPSLSIAVNLTQRQFFDEQLLDDVKAILLTTGMQPALLELEIGERLLIHDVENTARILTGLKALGVRLAIDDFGTGYSSLALLQRFPLDAIKIDRSFVRDLSDGTEDAALANAIIAMGRTLSMTVVAQGVETREQAEFLRLHACDELQGFYFKRPLPAVSFTQLLQEEVSDIASTSEQRSLRAVAP